MEELEGPGSYLCPSPHAYPRCKIWSLDFQSVTMPLRVSFKWWDVITYKVVMP